MTDWPNWKPNSVLTAAQLLALENYLLTPWSFTADFCAGVDSIRPDSLAAQRAGDTLTVSARAIRGLTSGGCPVCVDENAPIQAQIAMKPDGTAAFDAVVVVNDSTAQTKLALELRETSGAVETRECLKLGSFEWDAAGALRRTMRPPVRRLAALSQDADWAQWVEPVGNAIKSLSARLSVPAQMDDTRLIAFAAEIHRLRFEWPTLTVVAMLRAAQFFSWLGKRQHDDVAIPSSSATASDAGQLQERSSDRLPEQLAKFFLESVPTVSPEVRLTREKDYQFAQGSGGITIKVTRSLSAGKLELRFPASRFDVKQPITIYRGEIVATVSGRQAGAEIRFALTLEKDQPDGFSFDVLSGQLAAPAPVAFELWHSRKSEA